MIVETSPAAAATHTTSAHSARARESSCSLNAPPTSMMSENGGKNECIHYSDFKSHQGSANAG